LFLRPAGWACSEEPADELRWNTSISEVFLVKFGIDFAYPGYMGERTGVLEETGRI